MATGHSQFIGAAGQFYLGYSISSHFINASITIGNAPSVDLIASSGDGRYSLSFQVKTSPNAYRHSHYKREGYEWHVSSSVIGKHSESFWYAFIDLQETDDTWNPNIFFVPSRWVSEFVKPDWSPYLYFLPIEVKDLTLNRWDLVEGYLKGNQFAIDWANNWPEEKLAKWGTD